MCLCTIKDLQDVKLLLCLEQLKVQGDVVALLHTDHPRAHLLVGVVFREAWTQDHARGVEQHLVIGASHWKESKVEPVRSRRTIAYQRVEICRHRSALQTSPPCCCYFHCLAIQYDYHVS